MKFISRKVSFTVNNDLENSTKLLDFLASKKEQGSFLKFVPFWGKKSNDEYILKKRPKINVDSRKNYLSILRISLSATGNKTKIDGNISYPNSTVYIKFILSLILWGALINRWFSIGQDDDSGVEFIFSFLVTTILWGSTFLFFNSEVKAYKKALISYLSKDATMVKEDNSSFNDVIEKTLSVRSIKGF